MRPESRTPRRLHWMVVVCGVSVTTPSAAGEASRDLIHNGDFENGADSWRPDAALEEAGQFRVQTDVKRPGRVVQIENSSDQAIVGLWQAVRVQSSKMYELTGFSRSTKLQEGAGISFHCLDSSGKLLRRVWVHQIPSWGTLSWRPIWQEFRPPKGTASVQVRLVVYKKGIVWFDDLKLVEKELPKKVSRRGAPIKGGGIALQRCATERPVYAMDAADLEGDGVLDLVLGDIDGVLRCQTAGGRTVWQRDMDGLVLYLDCGDIDGDGTQEIAACTANVKGDLHVMDCLGKTRWTHAVPGTLFGHVTVGDLDGDGKCEVLTTHDNQLIAFSSTGHILWKRSFGGPRFRAIAVGDLDGDGRNEVVASLNSQKLFAAAFDSKGKRLWLYQPRNRRRLDGEDLRIVDVDGDGRNEVVMAFGGGLVVCIRDGQEVWAATREGRKLWARHRDATARFGGYQTAVAVADFCPDRPGLETLAGLVDSVWMLDRDGKLIWESDSGILIRQMLGSNGEVYLPSSGFRDPSFYRLEFVRGQGNALADHEIPNPIYETLDRLYGQVCALDKLPVPAAVDGKFQVIFANVLWPFSRWGSLERLKLVSDSLKAKESEHLEFILMLWPKDLPVELHRGGMMEQDEVLKVVRCLEELDQPFMFFADHGCSPNLSLDTIERTFQLAPRTCRGMYAAENTAHYPSPKWDEFVEWATKVMDLCQRYGGKKVVFKEMFESWAFVPADPQVRATLLHPKYRDTIVVIYATNNPYAPELQVGGMAGLKHAGYVSDWGISTQYWNWSWGAHRTRQDHWPICPADVILGMELSTACLGGRWFHIEGGQEYLVRGTAKVSARAKRHRDLVYELIRKNVLLPVSDADNMSFSNVVLARQFHSLVAELRAKGGRAGPPYSRPLGPLRTGLLGVNDALQTTPPYYFPAYAYGSNRYIQTMVPKTPYGYVRIVPDDERSQPFLAGKRAIFTDGCDVVIDAQRTSASAAKAHVLRALREEAGKLAVRAPGAAVFVHRVAGRYRVFLLDPGYLCPQGVVTTLDLSPAVSAAGVRDLVSCRPLDLRAGPLKVRPGAFRVLDIALQ